ncbi:retention module-containing protein [Chromatiaceae bacterium AAb-1]|nr:retention module-containing protein [Chromatiaceae bacterium AAb-1]
MSQVIAVVAATDGEVAVITANGAARTVAAGDYLYAGDMLRTAPGAFIELGLGDDDFFLLGENQQLQVTPDILTPQDSDVTEHAIQRDSADDILALLEGEGDLLEQLEVTAAGIEGGQGSSGGSFVRLSRIVENIDPVSFNFSSFIEPAALLAGFEDDAVTNHSPEIANDGSIATGTVVEAGHLRDGTPAPGVPVASGQLAAVDIDFGAVLTWSIQGANSDTYGSFTLDPSSGEWRYQLDNSLPATQGLKEGESVTQQYLVRVTDEFGAYDEQVVTVTIHGTNDAPVAVADSASVTEDGTQTAGSGINNTTSIVRGNVLTNDTDVDQGDNREVTGVSSGSHSSASGSVGAVINGLYGTVVINADGTYSYHLDNSKPQVQALADGQTVNDIFTYTIKDAAGAISTTTLTITVQGTNDAPVISLATGDSDQAALTETSSAQGDTGLQTTGTLTLTDVDTRDIVTTSVLGVSTTGSYAGAVPSDSALLQMLQVSGALNNTQQTGKINWAFNSGAENFNFLPEGETLVLTYTIQARDSSGTATSGSNLQTITITVTGTGTDEPGSIGNVTHSVKEDHSLSGNLFDEAGKQDPDSGEYLAVTGFTVDGMSGNFAPGTTVDIVLGGSSNVIGSLTLNADGSYSFTPVENYSGPVPQITYYANSGNKPVGSATLNLTVTPVSDAPDLGNISNNVVTFEGSAVALGFNAPLVTDNIDKNGTADGDNPELLGLIILAGIPAGVQLHYGDNIFIASGRPLIIKLTDVSNQLPVLGPYDIGMTTAQFEALKILPDTDSHQDFKVTMKVTSYEVDNAGKPLSGVPGATAIKEVMVDVDAAVDSAGSFMLTTPAGDLAGHEDQALAADTFAWLLAEQGSAAPATETILNFSTNEGDVLDLRDLLPGTTSENITDYLSLSKAGNDSVLSVQQADQGGVTQQIVLQDVDFSSFGSTESEILNALISQGNIRIDN